MDICAETSYIYFNQSEAIITSPGYPNSNYPIRKECEKVVQFEEETLFQIKFLGDFEIEASRECKYDFIETRNGDTEDDPLILKACGDETPQVTTLTGRSLWIKFKSDISNTFKGFSLKITKLSQSSQSEGRF